MTRPCYIPHYAHNIKVMEIWESRRSMAKIISCLLHLFSHLVQKVSEPQGVTSFYLSQPCFGCMYVLANSQQLDRMPPGHIPVEVFQVCPASPERKFRVLHVWARGGNLNTWGTTSNLLSTFSIHHH